MKAGPEIHFLAGQLFTMGVAALTIGPRMPSDDTDKVFSIGGRLSHPFRRALLALVVLGLFRTVVCHMLYPNLVYLDAILSTIHVVGQSFLCLTTAYLLQVQLSDVINITPGRSLMNILFLVAILSAIAQIMAKCVHPNWYCLEHIAEALSCHGVLQTLQTYSSVTAPNSNGRGPFFSQLLRITEYWFLFTCIIAFLGEASHGYLFTKFHHEDEDHPIVVLMEAFTRNQENGVDDWTRLLIHSIFLNSLDELHHFSSASDSVGQESTHQKNAAYEGEVNDETNSFVVEEMQMAVSKPLRSRSSTHNR